MSQINFNLRIPEEINEDLIKIAEKEGRSKNKQIEQILNERYRFTIINAYDYYNDSPKKIWKKEI